jgi:starch phosphorylase
MKRLTEDKNIKIVGYLSAEFLMGPHLGNALINLGIYEPVKTAVQEFKRLHKIDLETLLNQEEEPGLGNGGLGRLAACFMDSLTTLQIPAMGYGIRYEFGIFDQEIHNGWQVEKTDKWLRFGNPWEFPRPEISYDVKFGGRTEYSMDEWRNLRVNWVPNRIVKGCAYDTPVPGYRVEMVNLLRLWSAQAVESFNFEAFNVGDYYKAVDEKVISETISKVLYPNDEPQIGKKLRLAQQYFFVSCSLQDMLRINHLRGLPIERFHESFAVQLNDTHPSIGVAELMRILVDEEFLDWDKAWAITCRTFAYTNHTLLSEALEKWPVPLFQELLPRHLEIIYEINRRFLDEIRTLFPGNDGLLSRLSLIDESGPRYVRMANLAAAGSHAVNGVAALHSELLKKTVLSDFYKYDPGRFHNVTNGVTPRRWLVLSNPRLAALITEAIGEKWITQSDELRKLERFADDVSFQEKWTEIKFENKGHLGALIKAKTGLTVDPASLFDIQVKRLHEYTRQHLNLLHVITLYNRLKRDPKRSNVPRTVIFGGKAAPGYFMAKLIIKLINVVADVVNNDRQIAGQLRVVFFPDFNVKNGQKIYPAAELSEQISTAGKEASGTGNMKFTMNGALTIGTLDGANVEIMEEAGKENFFLFGLTVDQVNRLRSSGYRPWEYVAKNAALKEAMDQIGSGFFSKGEAGVFRPLVDSLMTSDEYLLCADFASYIECQEKVDAAYKNPKKWARMSILNTARSGKFFSDRSIRDYAEKIWHVKPL